MARLTQYKLSRSEWNELIDQWIIGRNGERDRAIMRRRLFDGITIERLAEEFDLSTQRVNEILSAAKQKMLQSMDRVQQ